MDTNFSDSSIDYLLNSSSISIGYVESFSIYTSS